MNFILIRAKPVCSICRHRSSSNSSSTSSFIPCDVYQNFRSLSFTTVGRWILDEKKKNEQHMTKSSCEGVDPSHDMSQCANPWHMQHVPTPWACESRVKALATPVLHSFDKETNLRYVLRAKHGLRLHAYNQNSVTWKKLFKYLAVSSFMMRWQKTTFKHNITMLCCGLITGDQGLTVKPTQKM